MRVKDCMTKEVLTVKPQTTLAELNRIFKKHSYEVLPVVDDDNNLVGLVDKAVLLTIFLPDYIGLVESLDFIEDFGALEEEFKNMPVLELFVVGDLMVKEIVTITETSSVIKAAAVMEKNGIKRLPVTKDNKLIGLITLSDVCNALFKNGV